MEKKNGKKKSTSKTTKASKVEKEVEAVLEETEKEVSKTKVVSDKKTSEKVSHFLFKALASDLTIEVFPTPGGPEKQIIWPFILGASFLTAKNSITLCFTSSRP